MVEATRTKEGIRLIKDMMVGGHSLVASALGHRLILRSRACAASRSRGVTSALIWGILGQEALSVLRGQVEGIGGRSVSRWNAGRWCDARRLDGHQLISGRACRTPIP